MNYCLLMQRAYSLEKTLMLGKIEGSSDPYVSQIPVQLAAVFLSMIPIIILFVCLKNKIMGNLVVGGVKG